jgi:hypothetical protein
MEIVELQGLEMENWTSSETVSAVQSKHDWSVDSVEVFSRQTDSTPRGGCRVGDSWGFIGLADKRTEKSSFA